MIFLILFQGQASSLGTAYIELACLTSSANSQHFVLESVVYGLFPILLVGLVFIIFRIRDQCYRMARGVSQDPSPAASSESSKDDATAVAAVVLFLLQPSLVNRFALVFSCVQMGKHLDQLYLSEDLSLQCWSTEHVTLILALGLPMFVLYVIGVPMAVISNFYLPVTHSADL